MWERFRAIAARIGLSREAIEEVERGGKPAVVRYPLNSTIGIRVRPDPDWTARLGDAWYGKLVNSRREVAGTLPIPHGRLHIGDADAPERGVTVEVVAGEYEVVLTIAHLGSEAEGTYEEHVSHAQVLLSGAAAIASIEPLTAEDGSERCVEARTMTFAGAGAVEQIAAERVGDRTWALSHFLIETKHRGDLANPHWVRVATTDGSGALVAMSTYHGRHEHPVFGISDADGNFVGVLVDFYVDNRPWSEEDASADQAPPEADGNIS